MNVRSAVLYLAVAVTFASLCGESHAQRRAGPVRGPMRYLGIGWSGGNHWRTPGHDTSYFTPYSPHNSNLISSPFAAEVPHDHSPRQPAEEVAPPARPDWRIEDQNGGIRTNRMDSVYQWPAYYSDEIQRSIQKTPSFNVHRGGGNFIPRRSPRQMLTPFDN